MYIENHKGFKEHLNFKDWSLVLCTPGPPGACKLGASPISVYLGQWDVCGLGIEHLIYGLSPVECFQGSGFAARQLEYRTGCTESSSSPPHCTFGPFFVFG